MVLPIGTRFNQKRTTNGSHLSYLVLKAKVKSTSTDVNTESDPTLYYWSFSPVGN